jgi:uncharacterized protein (TIGR01244 family)
VTGAARVLVLAAACGWLTAGAVAAPLPESVGPKLIPGYTLLRPDVAGSGAPTDEGIAQLRELGIGVVVDLRVPEEGTAAEKAAVESAGLVYVSLPITPETLSRADVAVLAAILDDADRAPMLLHCGSGNRVGGLWMALRMREGASYDDAEAEGRRAGLRSAPMIAAVRRVVGGPPGR